jgi:large subunit ribosomal protein L9
MAIKLILREDVDKLGNRGEVVSVKPGYARNYLLPKGLAMPVTAGAERLLAQEKKKYEGRQLAAKDEAIKFKETLEGIAITLKKKAGEKGTLFGAVTPSDITDALALQSVTLDKRRLDLQPIKALGDFKVPVRLHKDVVATLKLAVIKEEE